VASHEPLWLHERGYKLYTINDEVVVDSVLDYSNLEDEPDALCKRLALPGKLKLPSAKSGCRPDKKPYQEVLGREQKLRIGKLFHREIVLMNYRF